MFTMIKNGKIQCGNAIAQNTIFDWVIGGRAQEHIDKQLQRFWELKEMFASANRLAAEETACE
jgi:hypothetical protein